MQQIFTEDQEIRRSDMQSHNRSSPITENDFIVDLQLHLEDR